MTAFHLSVTLIALSVATGAKAQQACPSATPSAMSSIDGFLQSAKERPWLTARGITATRASELIPLVDSTDAARCQQIGGQSTSRPAYFFWAGSYVIASTAAPFQVDSTGRFHISELPRVFVFDSTNALVYWRGK